MDEGKEHLKYPCVAFNSLHNNKSVMIWRAWEMILCFKGDCCDILSSWSHCPSDLGGCAICSRVLAGSSVSASPEHIPHLEGEKAPKLIAFLFQTTFLILEGLNLIVVALEI